MRAYLCFSRTSGLTSYSQKPAIDFTLNPPLGLSRPPELLDFPDTLERFLAMLGSGSSAVVTHGKSVSCCSFSGTKLMT